MVSYKKEKLSILVSHYTSFLRAGLNCLLQHDLKEVIIEVTRPSLNLNYYNIYHTVVA